MFYCDVKGKFKKYKIEGEPQFSFVILAFVLLKMSRVVCGTNFHLLAPWTTRLLS